MEGSAGAQTVTQRIVKVRRDYNTWVNDETLEDYALRFTPRSFRRWSEFRVANTALGAVSFLALEAIGGTLAINYGFVNALWAIALVSIAIFLTGLPISYYAARYGVDMDLLTRGAGFGYIGSTVTSLIYASFTFIFFAIEAAILSLALEMYFHIPPTAGYLLSSLAVIPLVTHGVTLISRLQLWSQPLWVVLLVLPYVFVLHRDPGLIGRALHEGGGGADLLRVGAAAGVAFSLIAQIGEQVDFLRFLPERTPANQVRWWAALLAAGPGWILPGGAKLVGGALLAVLALGHQVSPAGAVEPTQMYLVGFSYVFSSPALALASATLFVVVSQMKINVTNAYAGSLAWSNFFARLTHSHPGRVVWLVFNVLIALALMEMGVFRALEHVLGLYANVAAAWVGALVADLTVNKPLGLSPPQVEFKRAYLHDVNPVGVGAMLAASVLSIAAYWGLLGALAQAFAPFVALGSAFVLAPLIAWATGGRYYIARADTLGPQSGPVVTCVICENRFEREDMAACPAYGGAICSLCCSLDARCHDRCKPAGGMFEQLTALVRRLLPLHLPQRVHRRLAHYVGVLLLLLALLGGVLGLIYLQESADAALSAALGPALHTALVKTFVVLGLVAAVAAWWLVLTNESRRVAQEESDRQTQLLLREIEAHRETDAKLQAAKEAAESANQAKSRYLTGMSHELRTPLNSLLGYAQILQRDPAIPEGRRDAVSVIRRSGEHLLSLIDDLLDIARIEAGKLRLDTDEVVLDDFLDQIVRMFALQAEAKRLDFRFEHVGRLPAVVHADERRLRQILINLLANAVKFTDRGAVTFRVSYRRQIARFEVEDTGIGIAEADLQRIFLPFERTAGAMGRADPGTGLGLTISRMLTGLMGGELLVRSRPGEGSHFEVRVFLSEVRSASPVAGSLGNVTGYTGARRRILVVDDQASQREPLVMLLEGLGFAVAQADSGEACLRMAVSFNPDLILLDVTMPGLGGWETCRLLHANRISHAPVILVSANAFENDPERRAVAGCADFLVKPLFANALLSRLQVQLGLEWVREPVTPVPGAPASAPPPQADVDALRELGSRGHVRGILDKLEEIEGRVPDCAPWVGELRALVRAFRLDEYARRLENAHGG